MLQRMKTLIAKLTEADISYYKNDAPIMTDRDYDLLYDELAQLVHKDDERHRNDAQQSCEHIYGAAVFGIVPIDLLHLSDCGCACGGAGEQ